MIPGLFFLAGQVCWDGREPITRYPQSSLPYGTTRQGREIV
jgi:hypothetical protein